MKQLSQGDVLTALAHGGFIMKTIVNEPSSQQGIFYRLNTGQTVRKDLVESMVKDGLLLEQSDSLDLLNEPNCQTFVRATNL